MHRKKTLLWQLYPSYLIITVISLVAVTWYASKALRDFYLDKTAADLKARALLLERQVHDLLEPLDEESIDLLCKRVGGRAATRITVILPSGKVVGDSEGKPLRMDNHANRPEIRQSLNAGQGVSSRYSRTVRKHMMYMALAIRKDDRVLAVIRTSVPVDSIDETVTDIQVKIAIGGVIIAAMAAILSLVASRRISRPIQHIRQWAESIARGESQTRPPVVKTEEMAGLSRSVSRMASELADRISAVNRQRSELEAVVSSMVEGVVALDMEERIISMNQAAGRMFQCDSSSVQGKGIQEVVRNADLENFVKKARFSRQLVEKDIVLYSGQERILNGHGTALFNEDGNRMGALIVLSDVTRLRKLETVRRDFVANVSHEIKTPITAIRGFVETLQDGAVENRKDTRRFLGIIERHVRRLEDIIGDLLTLSRIEEEAEKEAIPLTESKIRGVLERAINFCESKAAARKIDIGLSCHEDATARINAHLLEQAFVNLLDNAIKYSNEESVVEIKAVQEDGELAISFQDKGIGIAKGHLPRLFERFYRVDKARSRKLGGTGLGLAIVKHIVQAHGGHVAVESTPGKGSTFAIHLPEKGARAPSQMDIQNGI